MTLTLQSRQSFFSFSFFLLFFVEWKHCIGVCALCQCLSLFVLLCFSVGHSLLQSSASHGVGVWGAGHCRMCRNRNVPSPTPSVSNSPKKSKVGQQHVNCDIQSLNISSTYSWMMQIHTYASKHVQTCTHAHTCAKAFSLLQRQKMREMWSKKICEWK